ncbi:hypothetical protein G210_1506, partial [Candida maltosa Xu316]
MNMTLLFVWFLSFMLPGMVDADMNVITKINGISHYFRVNARSNQVECVPENNYDFDLSENSHLVLAKDYELAIGHFYDDPSLKAWIIDESDDFPTWEVNGIHINYATDLYACGTEAPYSVSVRDDGENCILLDNLWTETRVEPPSITINSTTYFTIRAKESNTGETVYITVDPEGSIVASYDRKRADKLSAFRLDGISLICQEGGYVTIEETYLKLREVFEDKPVEFSITEDDDFFYLNNLEAVGTIYASEIMDNGWSKPLSIEPQEGYHALTDIKVNYVMHEGPFWVQAITEEAAVYYLHADNEFVELVTSDNDASKVNFEREALKMDDAKWITILDDKLKYSLEDDDATWGWTIHDNKNIRLIDVNTQEETKFYACPVDDANVLIISTIKGTEECSELTDLMITDYYLPNKFLKPTKPIIISGELDSGGDEMQSVVLSTDGDQIIVTTESTDKDATKFKDADGRLCVGESHFVSVKDGKLLIGDLEDNATPGWRVAGDAFYFNKNPIMLFVCKSSVVSIEDGNGCVPLSDVVYKNYEEPPPPLPTSKSFNIR